MAQYIDLSLLKKHVRSDDFEEDDVYLQHLLDAAEVWVVGATARGADELLELGGGAFPLPLVQAVLLLAGHWYNQREAVGSGANVPYTIDALVKPFRKLSDTDSGGGGGGDYDELEERVTELEGEVKRIGEAMPSIEEMTRAEVESAWDETMNG